MGGGFTGQKELSFTIFWYYVLRRGPEFVVK